ncbi:MAG: DUF167 domain-containing protein [Candidatus Hodarchaeales archaeon]|jgi:uncharacterized protein (TIGR00251 family)
MVEIEILVKPKAKQTKIDFDPVINRYIVHVQSKPINNQANMEIMKIMKKYFKAEKVEIISGFKNNQKRINLINPKKEL